MSKASTVKTSHDPADDAPLRRGDIAAGKLVPRKRGASGAVLPNKQRVNIFLDGAVIEEPMRHWLKTEWDYASWSESTMDSAIMGSIEECIEQLEAHIATGIDRIIFVPYRYEVEQLEALARDLIPRLKAKRA